MKWTIAIGEPCYLGAFCLQVRRLNSELHALGVFTTDQVEPHQRVPYEAFGSNGPSLHIISTLRDLSAQAFVQSRRLREAVQNCALICFALLSLPALFFFVTLQIAQMPP